MNAEQLKLGRNNRGWTQNEAALKLGVSQPYVSLLEKGERRVPPKLARKAAALYGLPPTTLPIQERTAKTSAQSLAKELAALGYPALSYLRTRSKKNPAEVLLDALAQSQLDSRLVEALPWVVLHYPNLDWQWLVNQAKVRNLQNRLGFVTTVARSLAEKSDPWKASLLAHHESVLGEARLAREGTLCHDLSLSTAERTWLQQERPENARYWNLLSDLSPEQLPYAPSV